MGLSEKILLRQRSSLTLCYHAGPMQVSDAGQTAGNKHHRALFIHWNGYLFSLLWCLCQWKSLGQELPFPGSWWGLCYCGGTENKYERATAILPPHLSIILPVGEVAFARMHKVTRQSICPDPTNAWGIRMIQSIRPFSSKCYSV